jgi:predicted nucleic acid-binding protein
MIVVADSSPLRYLIVLGEQRLLPELFGETWIPSTVLDELSAAETPGPVREFLRSPPDWLKVLSMGDRAPDPAPEASAILKSGLRSITTSLKEF